MLHIRHSVAEISRICLTLAPSLLTLPLEMSRNGIRSAVGLVVVVGLAGCAGVLPLQAAPEEIVKQRAQERWNAMLAGELNKAYSYMSPASREAISPELFRSSVRLGFWRAAEVNAVTCIQDACEATVQVTYQYRGSSVRTPVRETWVRTEGNWWHVFKPT